MTYGAFGDECFWEVSVELCQKYSSPGALYVTLEISPGVQEDGIFYLESGGGDHQIAPRLNGGDREIPPPLYRGDR